LHLAHAASSAEQLRESAEKGALRNFNPDLLNALLQVSEQFPPLVSTKEDLFEIWEEFGRPFEDQPSAKKPSRSSKAQTSQTPTSTKNPSARGVEHKFELIPVLAERIWRSAMNREEALLVIDEFPQRLLQALEPYLPLLDTGAWNKALGQVIAGTITLDAFDEALGLVEVKDQGTFEFLIEWVLESEKDMSLERARDLYARFSTRPQAIRRHVDDGEDIAWVERSPELDER